MFQKEILDHQAFGLKGELAFDGPTRVISAILQSDDENNNVIGRAFTVVSGATGSTQTSADPKPLIAKAGGNAVFAGILSAPKSYAAFGSDLAPTESVKNNIAVELLTMGEIIVEAKTAVNVGDLVYFDTTTGELAFAAQGADAPAGTTLINNAFVSRFSNTAGSLAVVKLTQ